MRIYVRFNRIEVPEWNNTMEIVEMVAHTALINYQSLAALQMGSNCVGCIGHKAHLETSFFMCIRGARSSSGHAAKLLLSVDLMTAVSQVPILHYYLSLSNLVYNSNKNYLYCVYRNKICFPVCTVCVTYYCVCTYYTFGP